MSMKASIQRLRNFPVMFRGKFRKLSTSLPADSPVRKVPEDFSVAPRLELTLAILKPHICKDPYSVGEIQKIILNNKFYFVRSAQIELSKSNAEQFYQEHRSRFFFDRLVSSMCSGEIRVSILARVDAITHWRRLMGPTKVFRTRLKEPDTIRGRFGCTDTRNATHGSDSEDSARREIRFFFPEFQIDQWYERDEPNFRNSTTAMTTTTTRIVFDEDQWIHRLEPNEKIKKNTLEI